MEPIRFNDVEFVEVEGCKYAYNYRRVARDIAAGRLDMRSACRTLVLNDLWFVVYFILKVPIANHPFWVDMCNLVQRGPANRTLDMWAREHAKSTIITIAETIQFIVGHPEETNCIFSYSQRAATAFLRSIKYVLETSEFLKFLFGDVLYENPEKEAWKWGEETGLFVKRKSMAKEATLEAYGLIEGMPTGRHFSRRVYDDVETADMVHTPDIMIKLREMFDMSQFLGTVTGTHRVVGTPYHHAGLLMYVAGKTDPATDIPIYHVRKRPATIDGTPNGPSIYLPEERLAELRSNKQQFFSQQLVDPTPQGTMALSPENLIEVNPKELPKNLFKFMAIDPAGTRKDGRGDAWSIMCVGVEPFRDQIGASNIYITDLIAEPMSLDDALNAVVEMYCRQGRVLRVGVEKVALSAFEIHVSNALMSKGKAVTLERGNLVLLRPAGRSKEQRIEGNVSWPLNNGKIHIASSIPEPYKQRLKAEMEKFPFARHDDCLDSLSYFYDMIKDYRFGPRPPATEEEMKKDAWADAFEKAEATSGWLTV